MATRLHCFHIPVAVTGLPTQKQQKAQAVLPSLARCERACLEVDLRLGRREVLSGCLFTLATPVSESSSMAAQPKDIHLPIAKIKEIIENDIRSGQYYVTGDLTRTIYDDNCRFVDPTTDIQGVDKYVAAIKLLFDPKTSHHELISIDVSSPHTVQAKWKLEGYLKVPWHPHILPYEGTTVYRLNDDGLVVSHEETWDISVWTAFLEFLTPSWKDL